MTLHCVELTTQKRWRNQAEFRPINVATCGSHQEIGDGPIIARLAQRMIDAGVPPGDMVEVYRDGTLCFHPSALSGWARGGPWRGKQPEHLKKHKEGA